MIRIYFISLFLIVNHFFLTCAAFAAGNIFELSPITVSAVREAREYLKSSQASFQRRFEETPETANNSLAEIASGLPFVFAPSAGGPGALSAPALFGGSAAQTLILMDGRPINSPGLGSFNLNLLPREAFGGIEAFYGPVSSRYGINGLSGAVNLARGDGLKESSLMSRTVFSSFGNFEQSLKSNFFRGRNGSRQGLFLKRHICGGERPNSDFGADYAGYDLNFRTGPSLEGYFSFFYSNSRNGAPGVMPAEGFKPDFGDSRAYSLFDRQADSLYFSNLDLKYSVGANREIAVKLFNDAQSAYFDTRYKDWLSSSLITSSSSVKTLSRGTYVSYSSEAGRSSFKAGINRIKNTLASRENAFDTGARAFVSCAQNSPSAANNGLWTSWRTGAGATSLEFSFNHDRPDYFKPANSYSAGSVSELGRGKTVKLFHAAGHRAPTLNDLFYPGAGNPLLKPESGIFNSIALERAHRGVKSAIRIFHKNTSDMIEWFADTSDPSGFRWTPQNINSFHGRGISLSVEKKISPKLYGLFYYETARYRQKNIEQIYDDFAGGRKFSQVERDARQLPRIRASANIYGKLTKRLGISFLNTFTSKMKFYYADYGMAPVVAMKEKNIAANVISDLNFIFEYKNDERIGVSVENLFNKSYARRFGSSFADRDFPMPGRSWKISFDKRY